MKTVIVSLQISVSGSPAFSSPQTGNNCHPIDSNRTTGTSNSFSSSASLTKQIKHRFSICSNPRIFPRAVIHFLITDQDMLFLKDSN